MKFLIRTEKRPDALALAFIMGFMLLLIGVPVSFANEFDFFEAKIRPVLVEKCYRCHSAQSEKLKGDFLLDTREGLLKGGESGKPAIVPRSPDQSLLITAIQHSNPELKMPPKEKLSPQQIEDFIQWIASGAPDPRVEKPGAAKTKLQKAAEHWAFHPPKKTSIPKVKNKSWAKTTIDAFILEKLEKAGLPPAPQADKRTLIRRTTYALTGLPPTEEEIQSFLKDSSKESFVRVVDRLLASPAYGERWGRHWLDLARYSDTKGYAYGREERRFVHSHVYRDWVIQSLNQDLPYNEFIKRQLAADQMDLPKSELAAMGFLTVGRRFLGVQYDIIDDRIDVLSRGLMGLTVSCARCHDHKFDPIPTRDYYALYGVLFNSTEKTIPLATNSTANPGMDAYVQELKKRTDKLNQTFDKKKNELTQRLRSKVNEYLPAVLDVSKLHTEEFYAFLTPEELNPVVTERSARWLLQ